MNLALPFLNGRAVRMLPMAVGLLATVLAPSRSGAAVIGLIGDSTVADTYGWGPALAARA